MANSRSDEEIDDILSEIMNFKPSSGPKKQRKISKKHVKASKVVVFEIFFILRRAITPKRLIYVTFTLLAISAAVFGISKIKPDLFAGSPFEETVKDSVEYDLYYPTSLPPGFKIETDSVQKVEDGVVVYAISDDDGKRITVSSQIKPSQINLDSIYAALSGVYDLKTHNGDVKVGKAQNGVLVAAMTLGDTWLLLNTPNGNVSVDEFNQILVSRFKKG